MNTGTIITIVVVAVIGLIVIIRISSWLIDLLDKAKKYDALTFKQENPKTDKPKPRPKSRCSKSPDYEITNEYRKAIDLLENECRCLFITGKAGTGKSTFIRYLKSWAKDKKQNMVVLAPTGVAALNVRGMTIHSFCRFPPGPIDYHKLKPLRDEEKLRLLKSLDIVVVDEISMVRADLFDGLTRFLKINGYNPTLPFGGIQMVLVGDIFQLPPIVTDREESDFLYARYKTPFFFSSHALKTWSKTTIELPKIYRQTNSQFINLLENVRENKNIDETLDIINTTSLHKQQSQNETTLTCTKNKAKTINQTMLSSLTGRIVTYQAIVSGRIDFEKEKPPSPQTLELKVGTQVMFTKNDTGKRWVNGTIGLVEKLKEDYIVVKIFENKAKHKVQRETWTATEYRYNPEEDSIISEEIGSYSQFPLIQAWAITIHKSQGKTLDNIAIDLGSGAFAHGQVYVGLSRVSDLDNLRLIKPILPSDIISNQSSYCQFRWMKIFSSGDLPDAVHKFNASDHLVQ